MRVFKAHGKMPICTGVQETLVQAAVDDALSLKKFYRGYDIELIDDLFGFNKPECYTWLRARYRVTEAPGIRARLWREYGMLQAALRNSWLGTVA